MKRLTIMLVLATVVLFSQCKKQEDTNGQNENGIQMVLEADNGGSKTSFGPNGAIAWSANDKIYVVTNGQCVGYVTNGAGGGSIFTGTLSGITESGTYDFHYYYVGTEQTIADEATSFTMEFSDQDGTLASLGKFHVGYGTQTSVEVTAGETVTAQTTMKTLVAMAYFDIAGMAEAGEKVFFYGDNINNQMSIDFSTNTPTFGKVNESGLNYLCAGTVAEGAISPAYVMLLPNHEDGTEELATDITFVSKRTTGTCNDVFNYGIIGGRFYCADGNTETPIAVSAAAYDEGTLRGLFSVDTGIQVHFSQGNLQYQASTNTWQFAEHQYDCQGVLNESISQNYDDWIDLFGWGTSGYNHGAVCYQPWSTSTRNNDYYAYGSSTYRLDDQTGQADWGYNAISNGGNTENSGWRTLVYWDYVFESRTTLSGVRYAKATVNNMNGVILLPDNWNASLYSLNNTNVSTAPFTVNEISSTDWEILESSGAVFLSAAGTRRGTSVSEYTFVGVYWSTSVMYDSMYGIYYANSLRFNHENLLAHFDYRDSGLSVRLVRDAE